MHAIVRASAAAAVLGLLGLASAERPLGGSMPPTPGRASAGPAPQAPLAAASCPPRTLPDERSSSRAPSCLPLPSPAGALRGAREARLASRRHDLGTASSRLGDEGIERLPDRPEPWARYLLPVQSDLPVREPGPGAPGLADVAWGPEPTGGVLIETTEDAPVTLVELEHQRGEAEVVLVGELHGVTVVTRHLVESPSGARNYLLVHGLLGRPGPAVVNGARLRAGAVLGFVGDDEGTRLPQLYFEVRQLRGGELGAPRQLSDLVAPAASIPCDPRNVLPLL